MKLPDFLSEPQPGEITLTGHRIGLFTVIRDYKEGRTAEQIAEYYPTLDLEHVRKVIAFALEHWDEVNRYVEDYQRELDRMMDALPSIDLPKLRARFAELYPGRPLPGQKD
jgi:uncharacterized protein (DUF433 family)